jgi:ABC-type branched-subunit amino acid transport system permease subunit
MAGLSIGQQAFVGMGAYAMFGGVILMRVGSDPGDPDGWVWRP